METVDNLDPVTDNQDQPVADPVADTPSATPSAFSWKTQLSKDMQNSPLLQKFDDSVDGLSKAVESHIGLEKLLGHEKVPIPKDINDVEGHNRLAKALGVPDKAEGYGLADVDLPPELKELTFDKQKFAETVHSFKLTPAQAKGLWQAYTQMSIDSYKNYVAQNQKNLQQVVNQLRGEWGDAYDTNVELGQMVINKFSADKEMNDFLTVALTKDPRGVKFLAKLGSQFAENKIGEFQFKRFSLTPEDAQNQIDQIMRDPNHPYLSERATPAERQQAIDHVNSLYAVIAKAKGQAQPLPPLS